MRYHSRVALLVGLGATLSLGGHASVAAPEPTRPNILLLVADDQRPDTIRALGNPAIETPALDRLVAEGTSFTRAVCAYPLCYPSRAEILTGTTVFRNGVHLRGRLDADAVVLPGLLRMGGYRTCHVGKWHVAGTPRDRGYESVEGMFAPGKVPPEKQFDGKGREVTGYRGWMFYDGNGRPMPEKGVGLTPGISAELADAAIRFIRGGEGNGRPFFLHVNFTAPHDPLLVPPGFLGRYDPARMPAPKNFLPEHPFDHGNLRGRDELLWPWPRTELDVREELALYYAVISHLDQQVGRIVGALEAAGQKEGTIVIFTSDNGLAIGSHGLRGKQNAYEHSMGVPLIFRGPGIRADVRNEAQCYLRDLFPTICELANVSVPEDLPSASLVPNLRGEKGSARGFVVGYFRDAQRMIRTDRWKLIRYPAIGREQLFDIQADPQEVRDLSADPAQAGLIARLRGDLDAWMSENGDPLERRAR